MAFLTAQHTLVLIRYFDEQNMLLFYVFPYAILVQSGSN